MELKITTNNGTYYFKGIEDTHDLAFITNLIYTNGFEETAKLADRLGLAEEIIFYPKN